MLYYTASPAPRGWRGSWPQNDPGNAERRDLAADAATWTSQAGAT